MLIRSHIGFSLDGFVATAEGLPAWDAMPSFGPGSHGTDELAEQTDAVVIGRTSFDQGFGDWLPNWPWPGKRVYVLTSRPLPAKATEMGIVASEGGPAGLVRQLRDAGLSGDVHVLGGSRTIQALLAIGALDQLGMVVLPVLLGKGIPLFPIEPTTFSRDVWAAAPSATAAGPRFRLERHRAFPDGAIELVYQKDA
jgi:dihydrofolate reductase